MVKKVAAGTTSDGKAPWGLFRVTEIPDRHEPDKVYLKRWRLIETPYFGVKLHHIRMSDVDSWPPHDHPWSFISFRLRRNYTERTPNGQRRALFWSIVRAEDYHRVILDDETRGCWTLVFNGRRRQVWGFLADGVKIPWNEFDGPRSVRR